jgi:hypothetical protein
MFKFKITLDRHNARQNLNYYVLPDPPLFSLPSTFKLMKIIRQSSAQAVVLTLSANPNPSSKNKIYGIFRRTDLAEKRKACVHPYSREL